MDKLGWKAINRIGGGRFSDIYKVSKYDKSDDGTPCITENTEVFYALKLVDPDDEKPPHNIRNEIKILSDLKNSMETKTIPNVITMIGVSFNNIEYGLIFPLLDLTLSNVIKTHVKTRTFFKPDATIDTKKINTMPVSSVLNITTGIFKGLQWIHNNGIIHRDINPNNILFLKDNLETPVIIDFGIAYQQPNNNGLEKPEKKFTDIATGIYKAPEILLSKRDYSNKVDIWAVGILLTLMLSDDGTPIFDDDAAFSDLVLLSNILSTFGSPPIDWSDCKGLVSFDSMNQTFFTKQPIPLQNVIPRIYSDCDTIVKSKLQDVFTGVTKYENKDRLSANDALSILLC
ncbi:cyclin-dependent kinase-activating kinase [Pichia californica]|uniref:Cyclin-dependent kinase-activating kinase n=1 Tax=Pichia californica TaxID=460514 RepID=A0A9P7BE93_9ASCO|nr:cyclin-dependent kinase-activating kinase [[Candida] californica]KAG0689057.1 cyclin-dependent kinase-activating kinase [[Candida] californica]